jgi:hypothetical protein
VSNADKPRVRIHLHRAADYYLSFRYRVDYPFYVNGKPFMSTRWFRKLDAAMRMAATAYPLPPEFQRDRTPTEPPRYVPPDRCRT